MNRLTIVILNYNTKELTIRAIRSALEKTSADTRVVVVDNASSDGSAKSFEALASTTTRLRVLSLEKNLGFSGGNNAALRSIDSHYVMLLNSDAFIESGSVDEALDFLDLYQDIGILSPYVILPDGTIDPACHRGFPTPWNAMCYFLGFERLFASLPILNRLTGGYHQIWKRRLTLHDIDACTGAAMIVRSSALEEVGLFDEQFFMYGEDLDWCYRFRQAEWRVFFYPSLRVLHEKHSSGMNPTASKNQAAKQTTRAAFYDAMILFYRKHHRGPVWLEKLAYGAIRFLQYQRSR